MILCTYIHFAYVYTMTQKTMSRDFFKQSACGTTGHFPSAEEQNSPSCSPKTKQRLSGSTLGQLFLCLLGISGDKEKSEDTKLAEAVSAQVLRKRVGAGVACISGFGGKNGTQYLLWAGAVGLLG